jgi:hypothetical protein
VRSALIAIAAVLALAGCGGGEERATARPSPTATDTPDPVTTAEPNQLEIRQAANAYLKAFAAGDWTGVCDTLVPSERRHFERLAGSCERGFSSTGGRNRRVLSNAIAGEIRIRSEQAVIAVNEQGWREPIMRLYAIEEDGAWGIARSKKRRDP